MILADYRQTEQFEEVANISVAFLGLFLSLIGFAILMSMSALSQQWLPIISSSIYGTTLVLLYTASILYHSALATDMVHRHAFRVVDHCAIFLLIAGTYTPMGLLTLRQDGGVYLLIAIWLMAFIGCMYKIFVPFGSNLLSTLAYIAMGWSVVLMLKPLIQNLDSWGLYLVILGGILYTVGSIFYIFDHKHPLAHAIWHFFVLGASIAHYLAILLYVMPAPF